MWFQHDGAPPHNSRLTQQVLNTWNPHKWIGRGGPVAWPPRSPDVTPVDFFLWNQFKDFIYREPVDTLEELENRLQESISTVKPEMLRNVQNNLLRQAALCIEVGGRQFEHLM
jgi:hypothetical protein